MYDSNALRLDMPRKLWSANKRYAAHWAVRARDHKLWKVQIALAAAKFGMWLPLKDKPAVPRLVTITSYRTLLLDYDNLASGAKGLLDAIVALNLLHDDSPEWVETIYRQEKCKRGQEHTVIEISGANRL